MDGLELEFKFLYIGDFLASAEIKIKSEKPVSLVIEHPFWVVLKTYLAFLHGEKKQNDKETQLVLTEKEEKKSESIQLVDTTQQQQFQSLLQEIEEGLVNNNPPELCTEGVNGTYFLKNKAGKKIALFKPMDEEGDSTSNPKNSDQEPSPANEEKGILPGEAAVREVAAYQIDAESFFDVPPTAMTMINSKYFESKTEGEWKTGSLQVFVENDGSSADMGSSLFPVDQVHKIGLLDLLIMNSDRHEGNILVTEAEDGLKLIPIDHGYSLPDSLDKAWFDWLHWSQAKKPFSQTTKEYIQRIDVENHIQKLRDLGIREECLKTARISTTLLKKGTNCGLTLFDMGQIVSRRTPDKPSALEKMVQKAAIGASTDDAIMCNLEKIMDEELPLFKM